MKLQNKLNTLNRKFQPKKTARTVYVQPQKIGGKDTYIQPRKTN